MDGHRARTRGHAARVRRVCQPVGLPGSVSSTTCLSSRWSGFQTASISTAFPEARRPKDGPVTIAVLSRLTPEKFSRRFLEHLPDLAALDARVLIAGRGPRRLEIEAEVQAAGFADRVCFLGAVRSADVPTFLLAADIGLHLTETWEEVHSLAILEMLAAQLPIVSQPRGCLPELVRSGVNGFLAEDEADVRTAIERLASSAELRATFGRRSREVVEANDIGIFQARYRELIDRLTDRHSDANVACARPEVKGRPRNECGRHRLRRRRPGPDLAQDERDAVRIIAVSTVRPVFV